MDGSGSFSNAQLVQESQSITKTFRAINVVDEDRPAKRRKTLPESAEIEGKDVNEATYEQLVMKLNGSTQESPVLNLSALHNIIP